MNFMSRTACAVAVLLSIAPSLGAQEPDRISSFTLIDADTDQSVGGYDLIADGAVLDLAALPTRNLNIRANIALSHQVGVVFDYDGIPSYAVEYFAPFALARDDAGDYHAWTPTLGRHVITARRVFQDGSVDAPELSLSLTFFVVDSAIQQPPAEPAPNRITSFTLINADTDEPIPGFSPISNGAVLDLNTLPTRNLNVRADVQLTQQAAITFAYDGIQSVEYLQPFALARDNVGDYYPWTPSLGHHFVTANLLPLGETNIAPAAGLSLAFQVVDSSATEQPDGQTYRIAISADGNDHDCDDILATAMTVALLGKSGLAPKLVYYGFADHIWSSNTGASDGCHIYDREEQMRVSAAETASLWDGFSANVFLNVRANLPIALAALAHQINESSENNHLYILAAGPMEVVGRAIALSDPNKRRFVTVVSHSSWNDYHAEDPHHLGDGQWNFYELDDLGVNTHHLVDQNAGLTTDPWQYYWMRDSLDARISWLWQRYLVTGIYSVDPSDAGMAYWLITGGLHGGDERATPAKLYQVLGG